MLVLVTAPCDTPSIYLGVFVQMDQTQILLVDDNNDVRDCFADILKQEGYEVREAQDGAVALELLHAGLRPQLILLDCEMPKMNGFEFLAEIKADPTFADIPVVMSSGRLLNPEVYKTLKVPFLAKPCEARDLLTMVKASFTCAHPAQR